VLWFSTFVGSRASDVDERVDVGGIDGGGGASSAARGLMLRSERGKSIDVLRDASDDEVAVVDADGFVQRAAVLGNFSDHSEVTCYSRYTNWATKGTNARALVPHSVLCYDGEQLVQWYLRQSGNLYRVDYRCCRVSAAQACVTMQTNPTPIKNDWLGSLSKHEVYCGYETVLVGWRAQVQTGNQFNLEYRCCELVNTREIDPGTCSVSRTTQVGVWGSLPHHNVQCANHLSLKRWQVKATSSKMYVQWTCCGIKHAARLGQSRTCMWYGMRHFSTFDGPTHELPLHGQTYWIVRNWWIAIQAYFEGSCTSCAATARGVIIGGRFLGGHHIIIKKNLNFFLKQATSLAEQVDLGNFSSAEASTADEAAIGNSILWDGQAIQFKDNEFKLDNPIVSVTRKGNSVTVALPRGLQLRVTFRDTYQDAILSMRQMYGVWRYSLCGNNNGYPDEEYRLRRIAVADEENMFIHARADMEEVPKDDETDEAAEQDNIEDDKADGKGAPARWECSNADRKRATQMCKDKFGDQQVHAFLEDCVYDVCFSKAPEAAAKAMVASALIAQSDTMYQKPKMYSLSVRSTQPEAWKSCTSRGLNLVKVTSASDNKGALEAIVQRDTPETVWIGGQYKDGKWKWFDGQEVKGYTNWDPRTNIVRPQSTWMCIRRSTGQWTTCTADQNLPILCEDPKRYSSVGLSDAMSTRRFCGDGHQVAMPKSWAEQVALTSALSPFAMSHVYWLGAVYRNGKWMWDDDSEVEWTNWAAGQPNMGQVNSKDLYICASSKTGKWQVCTSDQTALDVVCETTHVDRDCAASRVTHMGLSVKPSQTLSEFAGHCYYLGNAQESCEATCEAQVGGTCDREGLVAAASTVSACETVVRGFGMIGHGKPATQGDGSNGCTYQDLGSSVTQVQLQAEDSGMPTTCDARTSAPSSHRVCACNVGMEWRLFPVLHRLMNGEKVVIEGQGYPNKAFTLEALGRVDTSKNHAPEELGSVEWTREDAWRNAPDSEGAETPLEHEARPLLWGHEHGAEKEDQGQAATVGIAEGSSALVKDSAGVCPQGFPLIKVENPENEGDTCIDDQVSEHAGYNKRFSCPKACTYMGLETTPYCCSSKGCPNPCRVDTDARLLQADEVSAGKTTWPRLASWTFDPTQQSVQKSAVANDGKSVQQDAVTWWGFPSQNEKWRVQLEAFSDLLAFSLNGQRYRELDTWRTDRQVMYWFRAIGIPGFMFSLFPQPLVGPGEEHFQDSKNGCQEHPYDLQAAKFTMKFRLYTFGLGGMRCLRCEPFSFDKGVHLYLDNKRVALSIEGADPQKQVFSAELGRSEEHSIAVSYIAADNVAELYFGSQRVEVLRYLKAPVANIGRGRLGCSGYDRTTMHRGYIKNFLLLPELMETRPKKSSCVWYECPNGYKQKLDAAARRCNGPVCGQAADTGICCDAQATCRDFACTSGHVPKDGFQRLICEGLQCFEDECCEKQAPCSTINCGPGRVIKENSAMILCQGKACGNADLDRCCDLQGRCQDFKCPKFFSHRKKNLMNFCKDKTCKETDFNQCCVENGHCETIECPAGQVHHHNKSSIVCPEGECRVPRDYDLCCEPVAFCAALTCPRRMVHRLDKTLTCAAQECTSADVDTCCIREGYCDSYKCPYPYVHRLNASKVPCTDEGCKFTDYQLCCVEQATCNTYACPIATHVRKSFAADMHCKGAMCNLKDDLDTCCDERANCNTSYCQPDHVLVHNASKVLCAGRACHAGDQRTCCVQAGLCTSLGCPDDRVHSERAGKTFCYDDTCAPEKDTELCCDARATCDTMSCPHNQVHVADPHKVMCKGAECFEVDRPVCCVSTGHCPSWKCSASKVHSLVAKSLHCAEAVCTQADDDLCCEARAFCNTLQCRQGHLHIHNASKIMCKGVHCKESEHDLCCVEQGKCASYKCPQAMVHRADVDELLCDTDDCLVGPVNMHRCCLSRSPCSDLACPSHQVLKATAADLLCKGSKCVQADAEVCCEDKSSCTSMSCPEGHVLRGNAQQILCEGTTCNSTSDDVCCALEGTCATMACVGEFVHVANATRILCDEEVCEAKDHNSCCEPTSFCSAYHCTGQHRVLKPHAHELRCKGSMCTHVDEPECCTAQGSCSSFNCPDGYSLKPDAPELFCTDSTCHETQFMHCCAPLATCRTYDCPPRYLSRGTSASERDGLRCANLTCGLQDRDTCCERRADCAAVQCPRDYVAIPNASSRLCLGHACTAEEVFECCMPRANCNDLRCPAGYAHRMGNFFCYGAMCDESTDKDACCEELGSCGQHSCPRGATAKYDLEQIVCKAPICRNHECCVGLANCSSNTCPYGKAPRPYAAELHCMGVTCTAADSGTCCRNQSYCSELVCPDTYVQRHNASHIPCDDQTCEETDFKKCCVPRTSCASMPCGDRLVHRLDADTVTCSGMSCDEDDYHLCCEEVAKCETYAHCPAHTQRVDDDTKTCQAQFCSLQDEGVCCGTSGRCDTFVCPDNYVHGEAATTTFCDDPNCTKTDFHLCCVEAPKCSTLACPAGYLQKLPADDLFCRSHSCSKSLDLETCCIKKASCEEFACLGNLTLRADASSLTCADAACNPSDAETCCVPEGHCHSAPCHYPLVHKAFSDDRFCSTNVCSEKDQATCCDARASCLSAGCSTGMVGRPEAADLLCLGAECVEKDLDQCCLHQGLCTQYQCPYGFSRRPDAYCTYCSDVACRDTDYRQCCVENEMCSSLQCPAGYTLVEDAAHIPCQGTKCEEHDHQRCCQEAATCMSYQCPVGYVHKPKPFERYCMASFCADGDLHTCCGEPDMCSIVECPPGQAHVHNAHTIDCTLGDCAASQQAVCCAEEKSCEVFACPLGFIHKTDAKSITCLGACGKNDTSTCCDERALCSTFSCPESFEPSKGKLRKCAGKTCSQEVDLMHCCAELGYCPSYECPTGYVHRHDAHKLECQNNRCTEHITNTQTCCAEAGKCDSYACPDGFGHRPSAHSLQCHDSICTDADKHICCAAEHLLVVPPAEEAAAS